MKRLLSTAAIVFTVLAGTVSAHAADYDISTGKDPQYYQSTSYEDHYNAQYNYAGENLIDYQIPEIAFGLSQSSLAGPANAMGQIQYGLSVPGSQPSSTTYPDVDFSSVSMPSGGSFEYTYRPELTVSDLQQSDGSIATISIARVGLSCKVYEDASTESMAKGAGHYAGSGLWTGNVCLFGHNRGNHPYFNSLKRVKIGDTVTYKTNQGTRTYTVTYVGNISSTDYTMLNEMGDNRITLFTCIANQPSLRLCVQAVECK